MKKLFLSLSIMFLSVMPFKAQNKLDFELSSGVITPVKGPGGFGHTATIFFNLDDNLSLMLTTGLLKMENQIVYLRDNEHTDFNLKNGEEFKIIPFIFGGRYNFDYKANIKPFIEFDAGINYLSFSYRTDGFNYVFVLEGFRINEERIQLKSKNEIHIGIGLGGGFNYMLNDIIDLVIKANMHVAGNAQYKSIFSAASKYFSLMVGLNISI